MCIRSVSLYSEIHTYRCRCSAVCRIQFAGNKGTPVVVVDTLHALFITMICSSVNLNRTYNTRFTTSYIAQKILLSLFL